MIFGLWIMLRQTPVQMFADLGGWRELKRLGLIGEYNRIARRQLMLNLGKKCRGIL
jgi:hypothetical protein